MVAPIITFVFAGAVAFLAFSTFQVDKQLPEAPAPAVEEAPASDEPEVERHSNWAQYERNRPV